MNFQLNVIQAMIVLKAITCLILSVILAFMSVDSHGIVDEPIYMQAATILICISFVLFALMIPAVFNTIQHNRRR